MADAEIHEGGCHCGRVRFRVRGPISGVTECNCSICAKKGILHWIVDADRFELASSDDDLEIYRFGTGVARHRFCRHCGMHPFYVPRSDPEKIDGPGNGDVAAVLQIPAWNQTDSLRISLDRSADIADESQKMVSHKPQSLRQLVDDEVRNSSYVPAGGVRRRRASTAMAPRPGSRIFTGLRSSSRISGTSSTRAEMRTRTRASASRSAGWAPR